jgi:purine-binding chemotaxis protein CheW
MKKKRLRYSELGAEPPKNEPRVMTPVELARSLTPARGAKAVVQKAGPSASPQDDSVALAHAVVLTPSEARGKDLLDPALEQTAELLLFIVGNERFALPIADVEEAVEFPTVHFVPEMPPSMLGVISLRGALVPVYSPSHILGQPLAARRAVLIFRLGTRAVGVAVDDVEDALVVHESDVRELPAGEHEELVMGVVHHEGHIISIMRAASLVSACRGTRMLATS